MAKSGICATLAGLIALVAPAAAQPLPISPPPQLTGYVCEVRLSNSPPAYGAAGNLALSLSTEPKCSGQKLHWTVYHLSEGAAGLGGVDPSQLFSAAQLSALLNGYINAQSTRMRVRISTKSFGFGFVHGVDVAFLAN
jgi:hypothetical protein